MAQISIAKYKLTLSITLSQTDKGWIIVEMGAPYGYGLKNPKNKDYVMFKKLIEAKYHGMNDEGLAIAKENAEIFYNRYSPNPKVVKKEFNQNKNQWTFHCSTCQTKMKSLDNNYWWATSLYNTGDNQKYCSCECAEEGLSNRIQHEKERCLKKVSAMDNN